MAPNISVSDQVYEALKRRSKSWEDTPSKIIARLLKIDEKPRARIRRGTHFPGAIIEKIILFVLGNTNAGAGSSQEITSEIIKVMKHSDLLIEEDLEKIPSGKTRIENQIRMSMHDLRQAGYFYTSTREGIWNLNKGDGVMDEVREAVESNKLFTIYRQDSEQGKNIPLPKVTYRDYRLCFKKEYIEPLGAEDSFRIICGAGVFQMTKNEFYEVFDNIVKTASYQLKGQYHSKNPPRKAMRFKVF